MFETNRLVGRLQIAMLIVFVLFAVLALTHPNANDSVGSVGVGLVLGTVAFAFSWGLPAMILCPGWTVEKEE